MDNIKIKLDRNMVTNHVDIYVVAQDLSGHISYLVCADNKLLEYMEMAEGCSYQDIEPLMCISEESFQPFMLALIREYKLQFEGADNEKAALQAVCDSLEDEVDFYRSMFKDFAGNLSKGNLHVTVTGADDK